MNKKLEVQIVDDAEISIIRTHRSKGAIRRTYSASAKNIRRIQCAMQEVYYLPGTPYSAGNTVRLYKFPY